MRVHVESQIVHLMEGFVANTTLVSLFAAVSQFVIFIVTLLVESFTTVFADPGFVSRVDSYMCI